MQAIERPVIFIPEPFPELAVAGVPDDFEVRQGRLGAPYSEAEYKELMRDVSALVITSRENITAAVLANSPHLRVIGKSGARPSNVDMDAALANNIEVTWTPRANTISVAEMTLALILHMTKDLRGVSVHLQQGGWRNYDILGREISEMTLGIIGFGGIGRAVAERYLAFGGRVIVYDPYFVQDAHWSERIEVVSLDELLETADIISLHCDLNKNTQNIIDSEAFGKMKKGAYLVNTSRGGLVDEQALLTALDNGMLHSAALDVFRDEPVSPDNPLLLHPKVFATPHVSAFTEEAILRETSWVLADVVNILQGRPAQYCV